MACAGASAPRITLRARPLVPEAFAPFGEVIAVPASGGRPINGGTALRHDDVVTLDLLAERGEPQLSVFVAGGQRLPVECEALERHPLSTQAFVPLGTARFLVVVAPAGGDAPDPAACAAFITDGTQGVNYGRGVWHHPLLSLADGHAYAVLGRQGSTNFEKRPFTGNARLIVTD